MGRNVVEATNACRIRRTRGDIAFFRRLAAAERVCALLDFGLAEGVALLPATFFVAALLLPAGFDDAFEDDFEGDFEDFFFPDCP